VSATETAHDAIRTYHGQPVIREPVWSWEVPLYFYVGGVAGASVGLGYLLEQRGDEVPARRAWATALGAISISTALLISDLGRPERFLNMMRMFKVTSPMSVGSWVLSGAGASTGLAAVNVWTGWFPRAGRIAKPAAALFGLPLSTYTAALLANTSVPVWHEGRRWLPFVFGSGAALSAGAVGVAVNPPRRARAARRLALGAAVVEGPLMELMAHRLGDHAEPYKHGKPALFANLSRACIAGGTGLLYLHGGNSRAAAVASGALLSAGALATRWSVFRAGFDSAADPKYVVAPQRAAIERGERPGAARMQPRA
jgi:Polysulphide reductase, NrfD